jgi:hypothetical protein
MRIIDVDSHVTVVKDLRRKRYPIAASLRQENKE